MGPQFRNLIKRYQEEEELFNKIIVTSFVLSNNIIVKNNALIKSLLIERIDSNTEIPVINFKFGFEELINAFELAIPKAEKVINGAVYTPFLIKEYIINECIKKLNKPLQRCLVADISCGCGAFLFTYASFLHKTTGKSYSEIFRDNIFGLDISDHSIERTKILLSLLALSDGEDQLNFEFKLFVHNALDFDWFKESKSVRRNLGFDMIIGNPPYVRSKNIDPKTKTLLSNWTVSKSGNTDLYISFFEIGLKFLHNEGILGYITANSFFKSVNARLLRKYFQSNLINLSIIDFGSEKIFGNMATYNCICFIRKEKSQTLQFIKLVSSKLGKEEIQYNKIPYNSLTFHKGWLLNNQEIIENIKKIESCGSPIGSLFNIKNGIATLKNDIYIFKPVKEDEKYYYLRRKDQIFKIEKGICKNIIKPNVLKDETDIKVHREKIIYPYVNGTSMLSCLKEHDFKRYYPEAYNYLLNNIDVLKKRDKGLGEYPEWYSFGRTQALNDKGLKLLFPYIAKSPQFILSTEEDLLIYCGYAIFSDSIEELRILKKILRSYVFHYYIKHTSKPYSAGYFSYAKNYMRNFGICALSKEERNDLLELEDEELINDFLAHKYGIKT